MRSTEGHVDPGRLLRTIVLLAWCGFFAYLYLSGEISRYLGPRTYWVVPFGGIALGIAAVAHSLTMKRPEPPPRPSRGEVAGHLALLVPLLAVLIVPAPELGSLAARKKNIGGGLAAVSSVIPPEPSADREVSFLEIHYANESADFADAMGIVDGYDIALLGFVSRSPEAPRAFELTRFYVSCCAADAIPYSVAVVGGPNLPLDTWIEVSGYLEQRDGRFVLVAQEVERTGVPRDPYLY